VNAWGVAMFDGLAAWLGESDAAVICLQEVARTAVATGGPDSPRTLLTCPSPRWVSTEPGASLSSVPP
jgi:hypothetical protein